MSVTIREQSEQMKAAAAERLPAEVVEVFDRSIQDLLDQGVPSEVVAVGDTLESFTLSDATGAPVTLDELVEAGPAVIVFYRGGWCPYCNLALRTYQRELLPELAAFGARLVAISPQTPDQSLSTAEKAELDFTVLSDPGSRVAQTDRHRLPASRRGPRRPTQARPRPGPGQRRGLHQAAPAHRPHRRPGPHRCASWTSSPTTRPAPRSPTSSLPSPTSKNEQELRSASCDWSGPALPPRLVAMACAGIGQASRHCWPL